MFKIDYRCIFFDLFILVLVKNSLASNLPAEIYECIDRHEQLGAKAMRSNYNKDYIKYIGYALPDSRFLVSLNRNENRNLSKIVLFSFLVTLIDDYR